MWAFLYNGTARAQRVHLRARLRDAAGRECEPLGGHAPGRTVDVAGGHVLYLWPKFRALPREGSAELSVLLDRYGRLHVAASERATNMGAWDTLPSGVREMLANDFRSYRDFQWWGD